MPLTEALPPVLELLVRARQRTARRELPIFHLLDVTLRMRFRFLILAQPSVLSLNGPGHNRFIRQLLNFLSMH